MKRKCRLCRVRDRKVALRSTQVRLGYQEYPHRVWYHQGCLESFINDPLGKDPKRLDWALLICDSLRDSLAMQS